MKTLLLSIKIHECQRSEEKPEGGIRAAPCTLGAATVVHLRSAFCKFAIPDSDTLRDTFGEISPTTASQTDQFIVRGC